MKKKLLAVVLVTVLLCALAVTAYAAGSVEGPTTVPGVTSPKTGMEDYAGLLMLCIGSALASVTAFVKALRA